MQPGQRLILGTLQSGLKPPLASANLAADTVETSNIKHRAIREILGMPTLALSRGDRAGYISLGRL
jgi:hypothetical protein